MIDRTSLRSMGGLTAVVSIVAYTVAAQRPLLGLVGAGAALFAMLLVRARGAGVSTTVVNILVGAAVIWTLAGASDGRLDVDDFSLFIVLLLVVKILDQRRIRDIGQLLALCVFLQIGAVLTSNTLLLGLLLVVGLVLLLLTTVHYQLELGRARTQGRWRAIGLDPDEHSPPLDALGRVRLRRLTGATGLGIVLVAAIVFVGAPRGVGADLFGRWGRVASGGATTGFTDTVELGQPGLISTSSTAVLDLRLTDADGAVLGGPGSVYYLRGAVLDRYDRDRQRWVRGQGQDARRLRTLPSAPSDAISPGATVRQEITLRSVPRAGTYLFTVWKPISMLLPSGSEIEPVSGAEAIEGRYGHRVFRLRTAESKTRYFVDARASGYAGEFESSFSPEGRFPSFDDEEIFEQASSVLRQADLPVDPAERARASIERSRALDAVVGNVLVSHLRQTCSYTLDLQRPPPGRDPIAWFLFEAQQGHCEYFAAAMTALCRSVGVNARLVSGYVATDYNVASEHYVVRESNAHAWVEIEVQPGVWETYDPTPPGDLARIHEPAQSFFAQIGRLLEAVQYAWISNVVGFDQEQQQTLLRRAWTEDGDRLEWSDAARWARVDGATVRRAVLNAGLVFSGTLMLGIAGARMWSQWGRSRRVARAVEAVPERLGAKARLQAEMLQQLWSALEPLGEIRPAWQTPMAFAHELSERHREAGQAAARVVDLYYILAFGGRALSDAEVDSARDAIETVRSLRGSESAAAAVGS